MGCKRDSEHRIPSSVASVIDLLTFRRVDNESIDDALGRMEVVLDRAET